MTISSNWMDKNAGKYFLYAENLFCGNKGHYRYFKTIKDALAYLDKDVTSHHVVWRLVRTTDGKNFTSKIYRYCVR